MAQVKAWAAAAVCSSSDTRSIKASRPLVLPRTLFHNGCLANESIQLVQQWAAFWAGKALLTFAAASGLGLCAGEGGISPARVIATGVVERDHAEPGYTVSCSEHDDATLYGPAAYVNASCCEQCANAILRDDGDTWALVAKRRIGTGEAVCAFYQSEGGVCECGRVL